MLNKTIIMLIMLNLSNLIICSEELEWDSYSKSGRPEPITPRSLAQSKEQEAVSRAYIANYIATIVAKKEAKLRAKKAAKEAAKEAKLRAKKAAAEQERKRLERVHLFAKLCCIYQPNKLQRFSCAPNPNVWCRYGKIHCCECCCYPRICCTSKTDFDVFTKYVPGVYTMN